MAGDNERGGSNEQKTQRRSGCPDGEKRGSQGRTDRVVSGEDQTGTLGVRSVENWRSVVGYEIESGFVRHYRSL
jgi:hypothetical protein